MKQAAGKGGIFINNTVQYTLVSGFIKPLSELFKEKCFASVWEKTCILYDFFSSVKVWHDFMTEKCYRITLVICEIKA